MIESLESADDEEFDAQTVEPEHPDQEELDRLAVEAEDALDDDSDVDDVAAVTRRRSRLVSTGQRILDHLREVGDEWQPWPGIVQAVDKDGRRLAELSPLNGRIRQAALHLSNDGLIEIRYGHRTVFDAVRLLPAGYTQDRKD